MINMLPKLSPRTERRWEPMSHSKDNRIYVNYEDLSPDLVKALIATEDIRFAEHSGIDAQGLFRAIVKRGYL